MVGRRGRARLATLVLIAAAAAATPAAAEDVSSDEFARRVEQTQASNGSPSDLASITSIDGRPIDLTDALSGEREDVLARLDTLAAITTGDSSLDSSTLQDQANEILSQPPYDFAAASSPGPLERIWNAITGLISGEALSVLGYIVLIGAVLLVVVPLLLRRTRRQAEATSRALEPVTAHDYAAEAADAARNGDYATAVRMLFLDGTEHLENVEAVPSAATASTATVRRLTSTSGFLDRFDEIAYGGSPAAEEDLAEARSGWQRLKQRFS